jgi:hypothetical protein
MAGPVCENGRLTSEVLEFQDLQAGLSVIDSIGSCQNGFEAWVSRFIQILVCRKILTMVGRTVDIR